MPLKYNKIKVLNKIFKCTIALRTCLRLQTVWCIYVCKFNQDIPRKSEINLYKIRQQ